MPLGEDVIRPQHHVGREHAWQDVADARVSRHVPKLGEEVGEAIDLTVEGQPRIASVGSLCRLPQQLRLSGLAPPGIHAVVATQVSTADGGLGKLGETPLLLPQVGGRVRCTDHGTRLLRGAVRLSHPRLVRCQVCHYLVEPPVQRLKLALAKSAAHHGESLLLELGVIDFVQLHRRPEGGGVSR